MGKQADQIVQVRNVSLFKPLKIQHASGSSAGKEAMETHISSPEPVEG